MLPRADITGTRPVVLVEASAPVNALGHARQESVDRLLQLTLGKEYQAQVLSRLTDGSFLVKVDDAVASMKLPAGSKAGDTLDLTLLATQPRPTFILGKAEAGATTSISNAGRLIGNMLQLAQQDGMPSAVVGKTPLVATPGASAPQIASALQNAVAFSGLFYESHVAQWAAGERSASALLLEPAAKLSNTALAPAANGQAVPADTNGNDLGRLMSNVREWVGGERALADLLRTSQTKQADQDSTVPLLGKQQDVSGNEGVKLISLQLDTLEQRRIMWQGELFPGQPLEWEISDDTPEQKTDQSEPEKSWNSTVRFTLPSLGSVSATIRLTGDHVQVQVNTPNEETATTLRNHGKLLADALDSAGSTLDSLLIKQADGRNE
ncbi:flagellar hook-length control protein FliK [Herminiimonas fonticola]|uniref:Flagellar hook-length control protein FliK n=1 Tax=Herminiimonas fonticola TaxID=303380 RepID=A0A4R6GL06_9BURK|nr:flagellar hook-length control protein FliK [Herminiimonas fonticola]RBA25807.1 Flagellar hook-length control protein FliK [Herminiimonas fonticola]TDN94915.1 flagellar hook-length control protein FliK [Herminiimonas fonticola]